MYHPDLLYQLTKEVVNDRLREADRERQGRALRRARRAPPVVHGPGPAARPPEPAEQGDVIHLTDERVRVPLAS
jgi:hypothetical protein